LADQLTAVDRIAKMFILNSFLASFILAPALFVRRDVFAVACLLVVFAMELVIFLSRLSRSPQYYEDPSHRGAPSLFSDRRLLVLAIVVTTLYACCLLISPALRQHISTQAAQNLIYASILLQTIYMAHLGVQFSAAFVSERAGKVPENLPDLLTLLYVFPRHVRSVALSIVYLLLSVIAILMNLSVVAEMSSTSYGVFLILGLISNAFYVASFLTVRMLTPSRLSLR
jgi:hypothetical protein